MKNCTVEIMSPFGKILIQFRNGLIKRVILCHYDNCRSFVIRNKVKKRFLEVIKEFENYFKGNEENFRNSIKLIDWDLLTDFQKKVYKELLKVKWGNIITYSELAERLGNKNLRRMVGQALSKNPFPIIIPCHRVVGEKGLTGFSAGLKWKRKLLELEGVKISF